MMTLLLLSLFNFGCNDLMPEDSQEIGTPSASITADKMNILYVGIDNPITINSAMLDLKASCTNCELTQNGTSKYKYNVKVTQPGQQATITLSNSHLKPTAFKFRIKRIPDPKPCIGNCKKNEMSQGEFKAQEGIYAVLTNTDIEAKCIIDGFQITRIPKNGKSIEMKGKRGRFSDEVNTLKNAAQPGDIYCFTSIGARCPGDNNFRKLPAIVIKVK